MTVEQVLEQSQQEQKTWDAHAALVLGEARLHTSYSAIRKGRYICYTVGFTQQNGVQHAHIHFRLPRYSVVVHLKSINGEWKYQTEHEYDAYE